MGHAVNNRQNTKPTTFVGFLRSGKRLSIIVGSGEIGSLRISEGVVWWKQELVCVQMQLGRKGVDWKWSDYVGAMSWTRSNSAAHTRVLKGKSGPTKCKTCHK